MESWHLSQLGVCYVSASPPDRSDSGGNDPRGSGCLPEEQSLYVHARELGVLYHDEAFAALFPARCVAHAAGCPRSGCPGGCSQRAPRSHAPPCGPRFGVLTGKMWWRRDSNLRSTAYEFLATTFTAVQRCSPQTGFWLKMAKN